jgi:hypothetical protein
MGKKGITSLSTSQLFETRKRIAQEVRNRELDKTIDEKLLVTFSRIDAECAMRVQSFLYA